MLVVAFKVDCAIKERLVKVPENLHSFIKVIVERNIHSTRKLLISTKYNRGMYCYCCFLDLRDVTE